MLHERKSDKAAIAASLKPGKVPTETAETLTTLEALMTYVCGGKGVVFLSFCVVCTWLCACVRVYVCVCVCVCARGAVYCTWLCDQWQWAVAVAVAPAVAVADAGGSGWETFLTPPSFPPLFGLHILILARCCTRSWSSGHGQATVVQECIKTYG